MALGLTTHTSVKSANRVTVGALCCPARQIPGSFHRSGLFFGAGDLGARRRERMMPETTGISSPITLRNRSAVCAWSHQCCDVADVHRLPDVGKFFLATQPVEELAEV